MPKPSRMPKEFALELDISPSDDDGDDIATDTVAFLVEGLDVRTKLVNPEGPGGGCPEWRFTGSWGDIEALVRRYLGHSYVDEDVVQHFLSFAQKWHQLEGIELLDENTAEWRCSCGMAGTTGRGGWAGDNLLKKARANHAQHRQQRLMRGDGPRRHVTYS